MNYRRNFFLIMLAALGLVILGPTGPAPASAQSDAPAAVCPPNCTLFLPTIQKPAATVDLAPASLELTQAIQSINNSVTLIANRPTLARVTVNVSGSSQAVAGVTGQVHALRNNVELASSPLSASFSAPLSPNRLSLNDTLNFWLPSDWTSAPVNLYVQVNPAQSIAETNTGNNRWPSSGYFGANFRNTNPLEIVVVPINANFGGANTAPVAPFSYLTPFLWETYPISQYKLTVHAPIAYAGPTNPPSGNDWVAMLTAITSVHNNEDPTSPNKEYVGVVNVPCGGGCIAGIGWINGALSDPASYFSAVAFDAGGNASIASPVVAHEIGHNLGRYHAPNCPAASIDPNYPNSTGLIDDVGFNIDTSALYSPARYKDFMSYCSPVWTSKYGFGAMFTFRNSGVPVISGPASTDVFAVSGGVNGTQVQVMPVFRTSAPPSPDEPQGEYRLELRDANDQVLQSHPFSVHPTDGASVGFQLNVPVDERARRLLVYRGTRLIFEQSGSDDLRVNLHRPQNADPAELSWDARGALKYMVRASRDGGVTWQVLGLNLTAQQLALDLQSVPGGDLLFEVQASDGVRAVQDRQPATLSKHAPQVHVVDAPRAEVKAGEPLVLSAIAHDPEDGALSGPAVVWSSDRDGSLGSGAILWLEHGLSAGTHRITVSATDSDGNTSHDTRVFDVK